MSKTVEFFFDLGSPASYLAWTQLPKLCAEHDAQLVYRPMLLGGVFQATGNASPAMVPAKARHVFVDFQRYAKRYGVTLALPPGFPINTLGLMRGTVAVQRYQPERFEAYLNAMFTALWVRQRNLADPQVLAAVLQEAGFDPEQYQAWSAEPEVKAALKDATEEAVRRGVFGAPSCFVGEQMFFGQDRLEFVVEALAEQDSQV
ncbi:2-hydroxychromene-2-carboxylate isomerase [Pseudomonas sp. B21-012]|uniref:2-hydroxychromene-2-carboxylate isomerase n=1 Tax=unclassified Pseudomonas TaxID=196821 RepID=UPI001BCF5199|nr:MULTISPECIES: 2-hydroxychromene-2-carboxylate isomerase [unclassified Pseudomonas]QVM94618.1 2-hydroxychromene-2-carboxylate isomerase [Pseudomonas sp. SORT22]UVL58520.1 2-hydroxychromene-2-carboxylate isomerase [Pseudomonas sp. B21-035]UVM58159.1 2-hydroxychromene-2-carboxylate isomerase [Pseudomonas sp. B21-012]